MSIKSNEMSQKRLQRVLGVATLCICVGCIVSIIGYRVYLEFFYNWDDDNSVRVKRDCLGRVVRRIERKDGKLNGLFMMDYDWGSVRGFYKNGMEIGNWTGWYPGKEQLLFEALFDDGPEAMANRGVSVEYSPMLIDCTCYAPDGSICGRVANGIGCEVRYTPDYSLDFIKTYGYKTNYFLLFHSEGILKGQIRQVEITLNDSPEPLLRIGALRENLTSPLSFVEENGRKAVLSEDGTATARNDNGIPDFILGKSSYAIPRPEGDHLVFDQELTCSNSVLLTNRRRSHDR